MGEQPHVISQNGHAITPPSAKLGVLLKHVALFNVKVGFYIDLYSDRYISQYKSRRPSGPGFYIELYSDRKTEVGFSRRKRPKAFWEFCKWRRRARQTPMV